MEIHQKCFHWAALNCGFPGFTRGPSGAVGLQGACVCHGHPWEFLCNLEFEGHLYGLPQSHKLFFFCHLTHLSDESSGTRIICREHIPWVANAIDPVWPLPDRVYPMPDGNFRSRKVNDLFPYFPLSHLIVPSPTDPK